MDPYAFRPSRFVPSERDSSRPPIRTLSFAPGTVLSAPITQPLRRHGDVAFVANNVPCAASRVLARTVSCDVGGEKIWSSNSAGGSAGDGVLAGELRHGLRRTASAGKSGGLLGWREEEKALRSCGVDLGGQAYAAKGAAPPHALECDPWGSDEPCSAAAEETQRVVVGTKCHGGSMWDAYASGHVGGGDGTVVGAEGEVGSGDRSNSSSSADADAPIRWARREDSANQRTLLPWTLRGFMAAEGEERAAAPIGGLVRATSRVLAQIRACSAGPRGREDGSAAEGSSGLVRSSSSSTSRASSDMLRASSTTTPEEAPEDVQRGEAEAVARHSTPGAGGSSAGEALEGAVPPQSPQRPSRVMLRRGLSGLFGL